MFRSLAFAAALLILPNFASTQELATDQGATHEVVKGETLWGLAERYLDNPFRWPMIFEANRSRISDPHWIYPGQVFVIPGLEGQPAEVQAVSVVTAGVPLTPLQPAQAGSSGGRTGLRPCPGPEDRTLFYRGGEGERDCVVVLPSPDERTAFYRPRAPEASSGGSPGLASVGDDSLVPVAVPWRLVYASEWMEGPEVEAEWVGTLSGFSRVHGERTPGGRALWFERLEVTPREGVTLRAGDLLQSFTVVREEDGWGSVLRPTGILTVIEVGSQGPVVLVSAEFEGVWMGQKVRFVPDYRPRPGVFPQPIQSDVSATILGFTQDRAIYGLGSSVFLDLGAQDGIAVGDEFTAFVNQTETYFGREAATLQVVLVHGESSTARIKSVIHPRLNSGDRVRLVKKMH